MSRIENIAENLKNVALQSTIKQKHGCVAIKNGKIISPSFHNYKRNMLFGNRCGSAHSEMCVINYLINSLWYDKKLLQCIL